MRGELHTDRETEEGVRKENNSHNTAYSSQHYVPDQHTNAKWCLTPTNQWYKWSGISDAKFKTRIWTGGTYAVIDQTMIAREVCVDGGTVGSENGGLGTAGASSNAIVLCSGIFIW